MRRSPGGDQGEGPGPAPGEGPGPGPGESGPGGDPAGGPATGGARVFGHTADVGLELRGRSLEELLRWAAVGFVRVALGRAPRRWTGARRQDEARVIPASLPPAPDPEALLVNWLNFLIFLLETERLVPHGCDLEVSAGPDGTWALRGNVTAVPVPPRGVKAAVKAATYHGLKVARTKQGLYHARIILDV